LNDPKPMKGIRMPARSVLSVLAIAAAAFAHAASADESCDEVQAVSQSMLDAIAPGKVEVWRARTLPELRYTSEDGDRFDYVTFFDQFGPLPKGASGSIEIRDPKLICDGHTAILNYEAYEREDYFGQHLVTRYAATDDYLSKGGKWMLAASHWSVIPHDPITAVPASKHLATFVGVYSIAPGHTYEISLKDGVLYGTGSSHKPVKLVPYGDNVYFKAGSANDVVIFATDASGQPIMIGRRKFNDVIWRRVSS
jgi:hypothetical protein